MSISRRSLMLGLAAAGLGASRSFADDGVTIGGHAFGSSWRITTGSGADVTVIKSEVAAIVAEVDAAMSPYRRGSDVSRFNGTGATVWQTMPRNLCDVTAAALRIAQETGGAFDPTVGPIVSRFGYGPISGQTGQFSEIETRGGAIRKSVPGLTLDLCGIAKGYALDRIATGLSEKGLTDALIDVGGEVCALGRHPSGRAWHVAISDPTSQSFRAYHVVDPGAYSLATSGHAVNGLSGHYTTSHIIDPKTLRPAQTALASVTVLAPTAMRADALATALCSAGPQAGIALAQRLNISALFITDGSITPPKVLTGNFSQHILA